MQYTRLGRTGLTVSRICFGAMSFGAKSWRPWVLEEEDARPFYEKAWELGINFYDTADVYSDGVSEEITGRMLRDIADDREDYVIATKFFLGTQSTGVGLAPRGAPKVGQDQSFRSFAQAYHRRLRSFAKASGCGLHRPVSNPQI